MRFFLDNCLSHRYARSLHALSEKNGHSVTHLQERFGASTQDQDWLAELGQERDWVIVSGDSRIARNTVLQRTWKRTGLTAFFLAPGWLKLRYWDQAALLVSWWPRIIEQAAQVSPGSGFEVPARRAGRFKPVILPW